MLDDRPGRRRRPPSSGGACGEQRDRFKGGGGDASQSIWVVESCFSKTFTEPSEGGSVALTESTSGRSCAVAQKAASYSPNACSRAVELSLNGQGDVTASLCFKKQTKDLFAFAFKKVPSLKFQAVK